MKDIDEEWETPLEEGAERHTGKHHLVGFAVKQMRVLASVAKVADACEDRAMLLTELAALDEADAAKAYMHLVRYGVGRL